MPIRQDPKHLTQAIQAIKCGCRVVDARRQGTLRDFHNPPERELDIVVGRALGAKRERIGQVVGNGIRDPAIGEGNDKRTRSRYKIADPTLDPDNKIVVSGDLHKPVQINRLNVAAARRDHGAAV